MTKGRGVFWCQSHKEKENELEEKLINRGNRESLTLDNKRGKERNVTVAVSSQKGGRCVASKVIHAKVHMTGMTENLPRHF